MKKKLIIMSSTLALAFGITLVSAGQEKLDPILLMQVEAMAQEEWDYPNGMPNSGTCGTPHNGSPCTTNIVTCSGGGSGCNELKCSIHNS